MVFCYMEKKMNNKELLINLRKELHRYPELSHKEKDTAKRIIDFASDYNPDKIIKDIGGNGLAIVFDGREKGRTVLLRCELDGLPIQERGDLPHISEKDNIAHLCGHDGHMAIIAGVITKLAFKRPERGRVILLFQPAEETGEGAEIIINDENFNLIKPDFAFALHNIPNYPLHSILIGYDEFSSASKGMIMKLTGKTSHAAEPEKGINPALALSKIIQGLLKITTENKDIENFALITIVGASLGGRAFGTSAGDAELMVTLRSAKNKDMEIITENAISIAEENAMAYGLKIDFEFVEIFPATKNDKELVSIVEESAIENDLNIIRIDEPFKWSEDFGQFTKRFRGVLFGIGSGCGQPALHNPDYDFPDELIETGTNIFISIIHKVLN